MFFYLTYTITLGVWITIGNIKFSNPNHRRFLIGGGTMVAGEQLVAWHMAKQMETQDMAQETTHLTSLQETRSKNTCPGWAYPIFSLSDTCSVDDAPVSAFNLALALYSTPPEVCTIDDAPVPGTDLILAPIFKDDSSLYMPAFSVAPYRHDSLSPTVTPTPVVEDDSPLYMPAFSVAPYKHNSLTPAVTPAPVTEDNSSPYMSAFSVALYKHNSLIPAVIPTVDAQITSKDLAPFSHSMSLYLTWLSGFVFLALCYFKFGAVIAPLLKGQRASYKDVHPEYQGEVLIWTQSPAGYTATVVPKFDAFKLVDPTHDAEDSIIDAATFQVSVHSDNNPDGIHDLYSVSDTLVAVLPPLIETMDVDETHMVVQGATLDINLKQEIPYWENQSFIDIFREEMNNFLHPDPPLPDSL